MTGTGFDRVRPRTVDAATPPVPVLQSHDAQGKRALFSSSQPAARPVRAGIDIDCSRCGQSTSLAPMAAMRLVFPALHLAVGVRRGEREATLGLFRRRYPSWLRCPACGHGSWVRVTVRV